MNSTLLKSLDISNFRSIRGHIHAPLDAKVVLVHGENGAGKTSLLSAIELALTGHIQSLERADPGYDKQLLHRCADEGSLLLKTMSGTSEQEFRVSLSSTGATSFATLSEKQYAFFRERSFLPQSLLGQLLQIYQDSGNDAASPLAQFVGRLLGLDRLDALEAGLKPLIDVRNVRKSVDNWITVENDKSRIDRIIADHVRTRDILNEKISRSMTELTTICNLLELSVPASVDLLEEVSRELMGNADSAAFAELSDQQRRLASIRREIEEAERSITLDAKPSPINSEEASAAFALWEGVYGDRTMALRLRIEELLPDTSLPSDSEKFVDVAMSNLRTEQKILFDRSSQARTDITRHGIAQDERDLAQRQRSTVDDELSRLPSSAGGLGKALAELTSFITNENCPVCDRDFSEVGQASLSEHIHNKVRLLSASAERLLTLGRTRGEIQVTIDQLEREIESLAARRLEEETIAELDRRLASVEASINELGSLVEALREGARLRAADIAARRALSIAQTHHVSLSAAHATLSDFALSIGAPALGGDESFTVAAARLDDFLSDRATHLEERLLLRRKAAEHIEESRSAILRRQDAEAQIAAQLEASKDAENALRRAQALRDDGNAIRSSVDQVRSTIIRREFNDRLNRVWRDIFIRLAPMEPFVPAFRIPASSTQKLQPKLITKHRDGGEAGGAPGAMLSAGNLNTAALTLFVALHLSVPTELPWLILDDPVQSMDDVHISHFAALLRTLSKEHDRQVIIAIHDRQLFEYLKLELSPAFPEDSLLTLELSRSARRDSVCISNRVSYRKEATFLAVA
ncbi:AAA family ATPase [Stenotrophomonas lactitubi]|uniref:AAA family ATPase n=1 Tax=Stenotrophomonas lactitubi TaxID=2045214 RepID=UPI001DD4C409|nr:AAA family ATPase [Stenotrophomonas lactitubi]CAH0238903.1 DNA replication and repair protein RecF [Stenotrophomonas lactitubi]